MPNSREIIRRLESAGWRCVRVKGDHHQFKHPDKAELVTVLHPKRDLALGTLMDIERKSGVKMHP